MISESRTDRNRDERERSRTKNEIEIRILDKKKMNRMWKRMYRGKREGETLSSSKNVIKK
jgi:hypothetical protein